MARGPIDLWNQWATQILVLLSLTLQRKMASASVHSSLFPQSNQDCFFKKFKEVVGKDGAYGERTWALKYANLSSIRSSVDVVETPPERRLRYYYPPSSLPRRDGEDADEEELLLVAHSHFHICKRAMADSSVEVHSGDYDSKIFSYGWKEMCRVVEMELSLMYDILYTKAAVMHTWFGFAIRVVSPLAVAAALGLFRLEDDLGSYRQIDVDITYALLVAAFVLETTSLCRAIGSTWIAALLQTT
uniref:DUF4220 domain-containing protein n=1 Tax=Oryza nivara TaxID=4536 RepID=A0A0E0GXK0_ORYNI